nr:MAG TPA: NikA, BACTERIAL CONJUGATION, RELAXASE, DNA [Caudoviricetes sp.]
MSPTKGRPPIENPKNIRLEIRMTQKQATILAECADKLQVTKTDVITKGIELVKAELDKK